MARTLRVSEKSQNPEEDPFATSTRSSRPSATQRASRTSSSWRTPSRRGVSVSRTENEAETLGDSSQNSINRVSTKRLLNESKRNSTSKSNLKLTIFLIIIFIALCIYFYFKKKTIIYCNPGMIDSSCTSCPLNGNCVDGVLECDSLFIKQRSHSDDSYVCVQNEAAHRRGRDLLDRLSLMLRDRYGVVECGAAPETADGPPSYTYEEATEILPYLRIYPGMKTPPSGISAEMLMASLSVDDIPSLWFARRDADASRSLTTVHVTSIETLKEHNLLRIYAPSDSVSVGGSNRIVPMVANLPLTCRARRQLSSIISCGVLLLIIMLKIRSSIKWRKQLKHAVSIIKENTAILPNGVVTGPSAQQIAACFSFSPPAEKDTDSIKKNSKTEYPQTKISVSRAEDLCVALAEKDPDIQMTTFLAADVGKCYWSRKVAESLRNNGNNSGGVGKHLYTPGRYGLNSSSFMKAEEDEDIHDTKDTTASIEKNVEEQDDHSDQQKVSNPVGKKGYSVII